jgi:hypothetical protein
VPLHRLPDKSSSSATLRLPYRRKWSPARCRSWVASPSLRSKLASKGKNPCRRIGPQFARSLCRGDMPLLSRRSRACRPHAPRSNRSFSTSAHVKPTGPDKPRGQAFDDFRDPIIEDVCLHVDCYTTTTTTSPSLSNCMDCASGLAGADCWTTFGPMDNGFAVQFAVSSPMAQWQPGNGGHVSSPLPCCEEQNHASLPLESGSALGRAESSPPQTDRESFKGRHVAEHGHAVSSLDVLLPRSPSQRRSTSPSRDAEGAVRQFISAVSRAIHAVSLRRWPHGVGQSRSYQTQLMVSHIVALVWQHRAGVGSIRGTSTERAAEEVARHKLGFIPRRRRRGGVQ